MNYYEEEKKRWHKNIDDGYFPTNWLHREDVKEMLIEYLDYSREEAEKIHFSDEEMMRICDNYGECSCEGGHYWETFSQLIEYLLEERSEDA